MTINEAKAKLADTTFLFGGFRRRAALKALSLNPDPVAAEILVKAVDQGHPDARPIKAALLDASSREWIDRMWQIWSGSRQAWLGDLLLKKGTAFTGEGQVRTVSLLKLGREKHGTESCLEIPATKKTVLEMLGFATDKDRDIQTSAVDYISSLPVKQEWNELIVDEWIRTGSPFLEKVLMEQGRLPFDPAKEALLFLVTDRVRAYKEMKDEDGLLFMEAFAMASPSMRQRINNAVIESKDGILAETYRRAMEGGKGMDSDLALRALMASGNEDGLVDAAKNLDMAKLLDLCERWKNNGKRPNDRKKAQVIENALAAYKRMGAFEIEPAKALPPGLKDIFEVWNAMQLKDEDIRQDLKAEDPFVRARGLFLGSRNGIVRQDILREKAGSKDWPERLVAAILCPDASFKEDHVHWVKVCAGFDAELLAAKVECGPDEYERCEGMRETLRKGVGPLAARSLALLDVVQTFRGFFIGGIITVATDDSAQEKGAIEVTEEEISDSDLTF